MKKRVSLILLLALCMPVLNNAYTQTNANKKVLFYLKTKAEQKKESSQTVSSIQADFLQPNNDEEDDEVYVVVDKMPEFPGGEQAMFRYLSENLKYPAIAQENGIQGRVICQFVVNKDGSITGVEVVRSSGDSSIDKEAVRLIKTMPRWNPGTQKGKAVRVKSSVPIIFKLY